MTILNKVREEFRKLVKNHKLYNEKVEIKMKPLKPEEAIGYPQRNDFPLLQGKEVLIQAEFKGAKGQAYTDEPFVFSGTVNKILEMELDNNRERALFISALNAILRYLNLIDNSIHCKDNEPEECANEIVDYISENFSIKKITLVGMQPAFAEAFINKFGPNSIEILDLNIKNFDKIFNGVKIKNSKIFLKKIVPRSDLVVATGSTIVNDTIDDIIKLSKNYIFYGTTIAGAAKLLNLKRFCFKSH